MIQRRPRRLSDIDPLAFQKGLWPKVTLYDKQIEVMYSVDRNDVTYVPAGNKLGKDYLAGYIIISTFLRAIKLGLTCRIITNSVNEKHLDVMWGEAGRFLTTANRPLLAKYGGPLIVNDLEIRRASEQETKNPLSYAKGMVAGEDMDALAGHHADVTLAIGDESSGLHNLVLNKFQGWAKHMLFIGNPNPTTNFFYQGVKQGDVKRDFNEGFHSKIIRVTAEDSPNVRYAREQIKIGQTPTDEVIVPGVLTWSEYQARRKTWDVERQAVGLDAQFYEGARIRMFPEERLERARLMAVALLNQNVRRGPFNLGVDPAEGGDNTALAVVDAHGLVELLYEKTPDTSLIRGSVIAMMRKYSIEAERVCIDRGGGGKQIADELRARGFEVRTVSFGEGINKPIRGGVQLIEDRVEEREERYAVKNMRAKMYARLMEMLDPASDYALERGGKTFALPGNYPILFQELGPIPKTYDREGVLYLLPKNKPKPDSKEPTLTELIGHSPDLADATVLAIEAMDYEDQCFVAGSM